MKILLLATLVGLAAADVSHLLNQNPGYQYQVPQTSYGAPQGSVLGNFDGSGSVQSVSYSGSGASGAALVPELTLPSVSGSALQFNSGFSSSPAVGGASSISGATIQTFENGGFSTPVPLTQDALAGFQASTPAPSVDLSGFQGSSPAPSVDFAKYQQPSSSYQFLAKLSQPTVPTVGINSVRFASDAALNAGQVGFGGSQSVGSIDSQFNSGLGLGGSQFISKSSGFGGSIDDSFGVQTDAVEGHLEPEVSKHLYFFDAPEDEEEEYEPKISFPSVAPKKTYKIIFIKAPSYRNQGTITIPAPPPSEEKTLVYVLVKKPEKNTNVRFQTAAPTQPSKPEVFFIKYKTQKEAEAAVAEIQQEHGATGQVIANLPAGKSVDHIQIPSDIGASSGPFGNLAGHSSSGLGGSSFDSFGARLSSPAFGFEGRAGIETDKPQDSASAQSANSQQANVQIGSGSIEPQFGSGVQSVGGATASSQSEASALSSSGSVDENKSESDAQDSSSVQRENEQPKVQIGERGSAGPFQTIGPHFGSSANSFGGASASSESDESDVISPHIEDENETQSNVDVSDKEPEVPASNAQDNETSSNAISSSNQPEVTEDKEESENASVQGRTSVDSEGEGSNLSPFKTYGPPNPSLFKKYGPPEA